jgi:hypothetical protein
MCIEKEMHAEGIDNIFNKIIAETFPNLTWSSRYQRLLGL